MTDHVQLIERLGYHSEHPVTGKLVLTNPDGPEAASAISALVAERDGLREASEHANRMQRLTMAKRQAAEARASAAERERDELRAEVRRTLTGAAQSTSAAPAPL